MMKTKRMSEPLIQRTSFSHIRSFVPHRELDWHAVCLLAFTRCRKEFFHKVHIGRFVVVEFARLHVLHLGVIFEHLGVNIVSAN